MVVADYAYINGGNGQVALSSAVALADSGTSTILFAAAGPIASFLVGRRGLEVICLDHTPFLNDRNVPRGAIRGLWNRGAAEAFRKVLKRCDPEHTIVHIHSWTKALSSSVVKTARDAGFEVVVTVHDYFAFCPNGSLYDHEKQAPCKLTPMSRPCVMANCDPRSRSQKLYRVARQLISDRIAGIPTGIKYFICVSPFSRAIAEKHLGAGHIFDVSNPIEAQFEEPVEVSGNEEILYVGRFSHEKGADVLAAAGELSDSQLVFVGDGPIAADIRKRAPNAQFPGWLDRDGVRARLKSARMLVIPSRWYEASPLVVYEAASMGIPSIVADSCAASRSIVEGVTGLTFRSGDARDLADKIEMMRNPQFISELGKAAYGHFWSAPPLVGRHLTELRPVYKTILANRVDSSVQP